jgi:hypothetical protein
MTMMFKKCEKLEVIRQELGQRKREKNMGSGRGSSGKKWLIRQNNSGQE